ncbi:MAG: hypothetical protein GX442_02510 [Candidatus Riflebacteria bacterium]|nr:hypothetical protein [Candidatus Riflebacteria bacterium]
MTRRQVWILAALFLVQLVWAFNKVELCHPWEGKFPMGDPDSVLYLRWFEQSLLQGRPLETDRYMTFPDTFTVNFPPLYLWFLVKFTQLAFAIMPSLTSQPELIIGIFPPLGGVILSLFMVLTLWKLTRNFPFCCLVALGSLPGFPQALTNSFLGVDHHWLENLWLWSWIFLCTRYVQSRAPELKILGGAVCAAFLATWQGAPFFFGLFGAWMLVLWLAKKPECEAIFEFSGSGMLVGGGVIALYFLRYPPMVSGSIFDGFGWIHASLVILGGAFFFLMFQMESRLGEKIPTSLRFAMLGAGSVLIALVFPKTLQEGGMFLARTDPILATVQEMGSILNVSGWGMIDSHLLRIFERFGLYPFFLLLAVFPNDRSPKLPNIWILVHWAFITMGLGLVQTRFFRWMGPANGLLLGLVLFHLFHVLKPIGGSPTSGWKAGRTAALLAIPVLLSLHLNFSTLLQPNPLVPYVFEGIQWLREHTPDPGGYADGSMPAYGVLNFWDEGNFIAYYGQRPTVAANTQRGVATMSRLFLSLKPDDLYTQCRKANIRFLFLTPDVLESLKVMEAVLAREEGRAPRPVENASPTLPIAQLFDSFGLQGRENIAWEGVSRFRCRFLTSNKKSRALTKIFEVVEGAEILGQGPPEVAYTARLWITFGAMHLPYQVTGKTGPAGEIRFRVAYPTGDHGGRVHTEDHYEFRFLEQAASAAVTFKVTPEEVEMGKCVFLPQ